jgi:hypothetical protein
MVYDTRAMVTVYWQKRIRSHVETKRIKGLMGLLTLSIVRYAKEHNFSETRSVSVLR